jgi:hypothetical protein
VCAAGSTRSAPSTGATNKNLYLTQQLPRLDAVHNYRPLELSPPSITIYHPVFAKFINLMQQDISDFSSEELDSAYEFIKISTAFYTNEEERQLALQSLSMIDDEFWVSETILLTGSTGSKISLDGQSHVTCSELPGRPTAYYSLREIQNASGEGNCDAVDQAEACYVAICSSPKVFWGSDNSSPCTLIGLLVSPHRCLILLPCLSCWERRDLSVYIWCGLCGSLLFAEAYGLCLLGTEAWETGK